MLRALLWLLLPLAAAWSGVLQPGGPPPPPAPDVPSNNRSRPPEPPPGNATLAAPAAAPSVPVVQLLRELPALKAAVVGAAAASLALLACLLLRAFSISLVCLVRQPQEATSKSHSKPDHGSDLSGCPRPTREARSHRSDTMNQQWSLNHNEKHRSGRKMKKTRKYDIITTPAERVEMAPLNEDDDEEEDSTVFDIKYR